MLVNYYIKQTYYGNRVKVVALPLELITKTKNLLGIKNTGENERKLRNNLVRSKGRFLTKAFHNFYNAEKLSLITFTFAENLTDLKRANKYWKGFNDYLSKRNQGIKWSITPETQERGAWHFHMLINEHFNRDELTRWWDEKYNLGKFVNLKRCRRDEFGTFSAVAKYCAKYITKTYNDEKSAIQTQLNYKTYRFSYNCQNPISDINTVEWNYNDLFTNCLEKSDFNKPFFGRDEKVIGYICDYSVENWESKSFKGRIIN